MKNLLTLFCLLLFSTTKVFSQEENSYDLSLELLANDPMTASGSTWIPVRLCNSNKADSFYVQFTDLRSLRYSEPYVWLDNEYFYSKVLCKIFNSECLNDSSKRPGFFISYKEYEQYNNPDSILKSLFHDCYLSYVAKEDRDTPRVNFVQDPYGRESWCYGGVDEDIKYSRELEICLLILFDHQYFISHGCADVIHASKLLNDKQAKLSRKCMDQEMILWDKKRSDEELKRAREDAMSKRN